MQIKCVDIQLDSNFSDLPNCTISDLCCAFKATNIVVLSCTIEYKVTTSYSHSSASSISIANEIGVTSERIKNDLVAVDIYFGDPHSRTSSTTNAFTVISLLSNIGGQLGLFLGISIISLVELGVLTIDEVMDAVESCFRRKVNL